MARGPEAARGGNERPPRRAFDALPPIQDDFANPPQPDTRREQQATRERLSANAVNPYHAAVGQVENMEREATGNGQSRAHGHGHHESRFGRGVSIVKSVLGVIFGPMWGAVKDSSGGGFDLGSGGGSKKSSGGDAHHP